MIRGKLDRKNEMLLRPCIQSRAGRFRFNVSGGNMGQNSALNQSAVKRPRNIPKRNYFTPGMLSCPPESIFIAVLIPLVLYDIFAEQRREDERITMQREAHRHKINEEFERNTLKKNNSTKVSHK